jgi:hypothetical protein
MGPGQQAEVDVIEARLTADRDYPVVPVLLRSDRPPRLPTFLATRQWIKLDELDRESPPDPILLFSQTVPRRPGGGGRRTG